ncbi:Transposon Tf2-11 polyprotein [Labeo rohita]|uniref:ribonuclease H n=1 Tax=Labeo rohita TaxID=84645 RepID=A0ABQ8MMC1_LABRO|nr:Transposon Tf2-11 polyprotein [Labeo rohita]
MEEYIEEALQQGYIHPSTSPAASSFFFVAKKDGGLWPCIDYRALNNITVRFRYPLPLTPVALEHVRGATVFIKLDLHSAYNLIQIREGDEWKTAFDFMHEVLREYLHRYFVEEGVLSQINQAYSPPNDSAHPHQRSPHSDTHAEFMFNIIFRYYGIPEDTVSDRGPQFISRVWKAFLKPLGVTNSWTQFLGWAELAQNSLHQPSTGLTPFQCILCYQPPLCPWFGEPSDVLSTTGSREQEGLGHSRKLTADLRRSETPTYRSRRQKVWLSTRDIRMRLPCKKLSPRYVGPFTIIKQINPVTYQLPSHYRIHSSFYVSLLKPYHSPVSVSTEPGLTEEAPPPLIQEDGAIYKVNEILDPRHRGDLLEYPVDWDL